MPQLSVFYDGACPLCSREIDHYRRRDEEGRIRFVDIARPGFDARAEGLDPERVHKEFHVRLPSGETLTAVRAFTAIWRELGLTRAARVAENPALLPLLSVGYQLFARVRPLLPSRKVDACEGACAR